MGGPEPLVLNYGLGAGGNVGKSEVMPVPRSQHSTWSLSSLHSILMLFQNLFQTAIGLLRLVVSYQDLANNYLAAGLGSPKEIGVHSHHYLSPSPYLWVFVGVGEMWRCCSSKLLPTWPTPTAGPCGTLAPTKNPKRLRALV